MKILGIIGGILLVVALFLGIGFLGDAYNVWHIGYWGTRQAAAENKVFENNTIYVQGKRDTLNRLRMQYKTSDPAHKAAIKEEILGEAVDVDMNKLPDDLRSFVQGLQEEDQ